ncbi:MAG: translation initiation factor [Verrucomicrobiota bacterium]|jgi:translation initiation factor IF-1
MPVSDAIHLDGVVMEVLPNGLLRVALSNGHQVLAHAARRDRERLPGIAPGTTVKLEMTPFDMSRGRVLF